MSDDGRKLIYCARELYYRPDVEGPWHIVMS